MQTITVDGFTGTELESQSFPEFTQMVRDRWVADGNPMPEWPQDSDQMTKDDRDLRSKFLEAWNLAATKASIAQQHNQLVPVAAEAGKARARAQRALDEVETRWAALETARAWHAAHHRWVLAVHAALAQLDAWQAAAEEVETQRGRLGGEFTGQARELYEQYVPQELRIPPSYLDRVKLARMQLIEQTEERKALTAQTRSLPET